MNPTSLNQPRFDPRRPGPYQEVWYLKVADPATRRGLWLQFLILRSSNQFRQIAEVKAVTFHRVSAREVSKLALKQVFEIGSFQWLGEQAVIGGNTLGFQQSRGKVESKGQSIEWDLAMRPSPETEKIAFNAFPGFLSKLAGSSNLAATPGEDLWVTGKLRINGEEIPFREAPGMQGHVASPANPHEWSWAHCNSFVNERGSRVTFAFEALNIKTRALGFLPMPTYKSFFILHEGKPYTFTSFTDALTLRSRNDMTSWEFSMERGPYDFRGSLRSEFRDFAGVAVEDTNGSVVYSATSVLSDLEIRVYRHGKVDGAFYSSGTATYEVSSRKKNPYVPVLV